MKLSDQTQAALEEKMGQPFNEKEVGLYNHLVDFGVTLSSAMNHVQEARREAFLLDECLCPRCGQGLVVVQRGPGFTYLCAACSWKDGRNLDRS